jgi:hypothetical protein
VVGKLGLVVGKLELVVGKLELVVDKLGLVVDKLEQLVLGIVVDRIRTFLGFLLLLSLLKSKNLKLN